MPVPRVEVAGAEQLGAAGGEGQYVQRRVATKAPWQGCLMARGKQRVDLLEHTELHNEEKCNNTTMTH